MLRKSVSFQIQCVSNDTRASRHLKSAKALFSRTSSQYGEYEWRGYFRIGEIYKHGLNWGRAPNALGRKSGTLETVNSGTPPTSGTTGILAKSPATQTELFQQPGTVAPALLSTRWGRIGDKPPGAQKSPK